MKRMTKLWQLIQLDHANIDILIRRWDMQEAYSFLIYFYVNRHTGGWSYYFHCFHDQLEREELSNVQLLEWCQWSKMTTDGNAKDYQGIMQLYVDAVHKSVNRVFICHCSPGKDQWERLLLPLIFLPESCFTLYGKLLLLEEFWVGMDGLRMN